MNLAQTPFLDQITEQEIDQLEREIGIAFDASRRSVLLSNDSFDVSACPGSGKTTLLVTKLALLAKKWRHSHSGICVLSHTNVARQEIEKRLQSKSVQQLLHYPHFIGTIHNFVNEYLALPLLRSNGKSIRFIDDEVHGNYCAKLLQRYPTARSALNYRQNGTEIITTLSLEGPNLKLVFSGGDLPYSSTCPTYREINAIKQSAGDKGLWRFSDMFAWAEKLISEVPNVLQMIRTRFPVVFIDEMQDTHEMQGALLFKLFPQTCCKLIQRFGDPNQAIFDFGQTQPTTNRFPTTPVKEIPDSNRFPQTIASLASPLAPNPITPRLEGLGPPAYQFTQVAIPPLQPTIILFDDTNISNVIRHFGKLLLDSFSDDVIQSDSFSAHIIGRVGKQSDTVTRLASSLGAYWNGYDYRLNQPEPKPAKLSEYFNLAIHQSSTSVDKFRSVKAIKRGIIELIRYIDETVLDDYSNQADTIWRRIDADNAASSAFSGVIWQLGIEGKTIEEANWNTIVEQIKIVIQPIIQHQWKKQATEYCEWSARFKDSIVTGNRPNASQNQYCFREANRSVKIEVGTIHKAKGETHTATLVVETFFRKHDFEDLLPWLLGEKSGVDRRVGVEQQERLRLIFTAMTRPTHLLCLAIRKASLGDNDGQIKHTRQLAAHGWQIVDLTI